MIRVLLVEDDARIARFLASALAEEGFTVDRAADGRSGLERATSGSYDVVVLDLRLPELDGISVLRGIKEVRPSQAVLVLSAVTESDRRVECLRLGAADFVTKPFVVSELLLRIRNCLVRPPRPPIENSLRVGSAALDPKRRTIDVGEGPVHLSEREFFLLEFLMSRAGEVCTRAELLSAVWGYSFDVATNALDVTIARLRAKLGPDTIETVRNVGYSFSPP